MFDPRFEDGQYVRLSELPHMAQRARQASGLSYQQAAQDLGTSEVQVEKAESQPYRSLFKLRRRMLERFTGYTLEGPFYRVKRK